MIKTERPLSPGIAQRLIVLRHISQQGVDETRRIFMIKSRVRGLCDVRGARNAIKMDDELHANGGKSVSVMTHLEMLGCL